MDSAPPPVLDSAQRRQASRAKWAAANHDKVLAYARAAYARKVANDPGYNMRAKAAALARDPDKVHAQRVAQVRRARERKRLAAITDVCAGA